MNYFAKACGLRSESLSLLVAFTFLLMVKTVTCEQWAVHVDNENVAKVLAESHDLVNLGEVLPNSKIYHFAKKSHSRSKRSAEEVYEVLKSHSDVKWVEQQHVLRRTKRVPIHRGERQTVPGNCFVSTVRTSNKDSRRCVFPFSYKGKSYVRCTSDHSTNNAEWCATEVKPNGEVVNGKWGDCNPDSVVCLRPDGQNIQNRPPPPRIPQTPVDPIPPRIPQTPRQQQLPRIPQTPRQQLLQGVPPRFSPQGQFVPQVLPPPPNNPRSQQPLSEIPSQSLNRNFLGLLLGGASGNQFTSGPLLRNGLPNFPPRSPSNEDDVSDIPIPKLEDLKTKWNDPKWPSMWFLNRGYDLETSFGMDMNVEEAWEQGATGEGVIVSILDDGVESTHPDLKENYDPQASTDLNDNDSDPFPRYDFINSNKHGTRCAGQVSASANNSNCGVGIAFKSKIGGVRVLDGPITDALEAKALSFNRNHIDIYSASWGPDDDGKTVDGPGSFASRALREGVEQGRNGKGSIFMWASGNGGKYADNCNCDGYTTSIYTLSVSSASENGNIPWYSEPCSSSMATTFSSGSFQRLRERKITTTDLRGKCTNKHTGTSASSPMAAGIVALALEINPSLTWRDVQHLVVRTARPRGILKANDWMDNAAGLSFSHSFGFGIMDAGAMVRLAKVWQTVPEQKVCIARAGTLNDEPVDIEGKKSFILKLNAEHPCVQEIGFLEHIHLKMDLNSRGSRGDITVKLESPGGTISELLGERPQDSISGGVSLFKKWPLMSVHFWAESIQGDWTLTITQKSGISTLQSWDLTFYGTQKDPQQGLDLLSHRNVDKSGKFIKKGRKVDMDNKENVKSEDAKFDDSLPDETIPAADDYVNVEGPQLEITEAIAEDLDFLELEEAVEEFKSIHEESLEQK